MTTDLQTRLAAAAAANADILSAAITAERLPTVADATIHARHAAIARHFETVPCHGWDRTRLANETDQLRAEITRRHRIA